MDAIGVVAEPTAHHPAHEALLYQGESPFLAEAVPFTRVGVDAGEPVMVAVSSVPIRALSEHRRQHATRLRFPDMREVRSNPSRITPAWVDIVEGSSPDGQPLRGIGEPLWAERSGDELAECERRHC